MVQDIIVMSLRNTYCLLQRSFSQFERKVFLLRSWPLCASLCLSEALCASLGLWELALTGNLTGNSMTSSSSVGSIQKMVGLYIHMLPKRHLKSSRRPKKAPKWLVLSTLRLSGPLLVHRCICTYVHTHIHTYIHTHIHTYPQTELRPGNWLAGWLAELRPGSLSCAWLAGWLGGWLVGCLRPREAQRGPERRSMDRTSLSCAWLEAPHKQIYK